MLLVIKLLNNLWLLENHSKITNILKDALGRLFLCCNITISMKSIVFLSIFLCFNANIHAQGKSSKDGTDCVFKKEIIGYWKIENIVEDLSGENLETEGQSWKITHKIDDDIKDKITLTLSPDGTFTGSIDLSDSLRITYGYWRTSEDCKQLYLVSDGIEEKFEIFSIEMQYLVLTMEDGFKMIFKKSKKVH